MIAADVTFYSIVAFVHVMAAVAGLGIVFAYPILWSAARNLYPRSLPYLLASQEKLGGRVVGPSVGLIILTGLYMTITEDGGYDFSQLFVQVGLPIALYLFLAGILFFSPTEGKLSELAERDLAASAGGEVRFSDEFDAIYRRLMLISGLSITLIAVAVFFMVVKP